MSVLAAGLVSVASALNQLNCFTDTTNNQCCADVFDIQNILNASGNTITTVDNIHIAFVEKLLVNDATDGGQCIDGASYFINYNEPNGWADFSWDAGNWATTIKYYGPFSNTNK